MRKSRYLLEFWQKENIVIGTDKKGGTFNLRFDISNTIGINGKTYVEVEKHSRIQRGGRRGKRISTMLRELIYTPDGIKLGSVLIDKHHNVSSTTFYYENQLDTRVENGFERLMQHFKMGGVPQEVIDNLWNKWATLDDKSKGNVFNLYRKQTVDADYGSSSISSRGAGMSMDAMSYADIMDDCINIIMSKGVGGNDI